MGWKWCCYWLCVPHIGSCFNAGGKHVCVCLCVRGGGGVISVTCWLRLHLHKAGQFLHFQTAAPWREFSKKCGLGENVSLVLMLEAKTSNCMTVFRKTCLAGLRVPGLTHKDLIRLCEEVVEFIKTLVKPKQTKRVHANYYKERLLESPGI